MSDMDHKIKLMEPSFEPWVAEKAGQKRIAMLMSGGVDSSVSAHLLKQAGWDVLGITMKVPVPQCDVGARGCCGADAAFVCHELGLKHYFVDVCDAFEELIIEPFRKSYAMGQTPNPCVDCNSLLKFSLLWDLIEKEFGIECVATGHYAKVYEGENGWRLGRGDDREKDQSYFLYGIPARRLSKLVLPLSNYSKNQIREIAGELGLSVAEKAESMELCFAGEGDYRGALGDGQAEMAGELLDIEGNVIGEHKGVSNYTIGQRRGLGYASTEPLYVSKIDPMRNTVTLGKRGDVFAESVRAVELNVLIEKELKGDVELFGKIRSGGEPKGCRVAEYGGECLCVRFDEGVFAPAAGQKLVLYDGDDCVVAGGTIIS
ncbi:MAG: tRNA 2-thiouridine(34) synthase MnmA [Planctomycetes bacterium]|nr:tRNA 2-thiouridine(34) synthase MnmA [Planctomycetota bacterium]